MLKICFRPFSFTSVIYFFIRVSLCHVRILIRGHYVTDEFRLFRWRVDVWSWDLYIVFIWPVRLFVPTLSEVPIRISDEYKVRINAFFMVHGLTVWRHDSDRRSRRSGNPRDNDGCLSVTKLLSWSNTLLFLNWGLFGKDCL